LSKYGLSQLKSGVFAEWEAALRLRRRMLNVEFQYDGLTGLIWDHAKTLRNALDSEKARCLKGRGFRKWSG
jgi:hypothetical protein